MRNGFIYLAEQLSYFFIIGLSLFIFLSPSVEKLAIAGSSDVVLIAAVAEEAQGREEPPPITGDLRYFHRDPYYLEEDDDTAALLEPGALERLESPFPASFDKTSEYMIGSVAVGIVLPESAGNGENWLNPGPNGIDREQKVINEIQNGLQWWLTRDMNAGSKAKLSFIYDIQLRVTTSYEPIKTETLDENRDGLYDEGLWIQEVMENLSKPAPQGRGLGFSIIPPAGYCPTNKFDTDYAACPYGYAVRSYNNFLRDKYTTDWAFTIFVVDSLNDKLNDTVSPGMFPDKYFAYAYAGGPFLVMTYDNNGYTVDNMDAVLAHEFGHIFYALDQYSPCDPTEQSGFLSVVNGNCNGPEPSIMKGQPEPFTKGYLDYYAKGQIGWWDSDNNGIYDPVDTIPVVELLGYSAGQPIFGTARDTENRIVSVLFRINSGQWQDALPSDGSFNASSEDFAIPSPPCGPNLEVKAINTVYNESLPKTLTLPGSVGDVNGDGIPDSQDSSAALRIATGSPSPTLFLDCGDIDGDKRISLREAIYLLQKSRGLR